MRTVLYQSEAYRELVKRGWTCHRIETWGGRPVAVMYSPARTVKA